MLARALSPFADRAYALLRIVAGAMFLCHGLQKIFGLLEHAKATDPIEIVGGWVELVAGACICVGACTRLMAFLASGQMAVAYFMFHVVGKPDAAGNRDIQLVPILNHGELAVLYCFVFLYIACRGSGRWAVDPLLVRRRPA